MNKYGSRSGGVKGHISSTAAERVLHILILLDGASGLRETRVEGQQHSMPA